MVDVAANFSGSMPEHYDRIMGPAQFDAFGKDLAGRLPQAPPGNVLEVACGTGVVTRHLRARLDPALGLVATDLSKAMLDYARGKLRGVPGIEWREADMCRLPFADGAFGAVVCAFGVMFVPDKAAAFRDMRRVLRPGGTLLFNVWDGLAANLHSSTTNDVIQGMFPGDPEMRFDAPFKFNDKAVLRRMLAEAGLSEERMDAVQLPISAPSARDYATGQLKGTPRGALFEARGVKADDVVDRVAAALAKVGGDKPFRSSAQALVIEARAA